ncbi:MAG: apolipoprotein N-acyltransferase [Acetobacteraceae bacterium]|nr:apolipoprotein N-acyltransferase [Acetobacteraceae bacterium]
MLQGWRADGAALLLGLLSAASLPPLHVVPVLWVGIPGLLVLLDGTRSVRQAARRGWWFGFGFHLAGLYWITEAILIEAARFWWFVPLAVPALSAVLALFIALAAGLARRAPPGWGRIFVLAGGWVLADMARQYVATGFPWNPLGSVWAIPGPVGDVMLQPAAWIGGPGLTLLTLLLAAAPCFGRAGRIGCALLLAGWVILGWTRLQDTPETVGPSKVVLVQGDVAQGQKWDRALAVSVFERYLALTRQGAAEAGADLAAVIWPETASPFLLEQDVAARAEIARMARGVPALVGSVRFDPSDRPRNSLVVIEPDGSIGGIYDKWHLVPFGEFQPSWFPLPIQVVPGGGFSGGPGPQTLHIPGLAAAGPLICYEAVYPGEMVDEADRPAWLVNITNDAWFGYTAGPRQHLAAARMRAVEEGLPLLRAANTGITAGFDALGRELGRLPMGTPGYLVVKLPSPLPPTPFGRWRLLIPFVISAGILAAGLASCYRPVTRF